MVQSVLITNVRRWKWLSAQGKVPIQGHLEEEVSSVFIKDGHIGAIVASDDPSISTSLLDNTVVIDGKGHALLPGLSDSHIHVAGLGESKYFVQLDGCGSIADLKNRVKLHRESNSELSWIQGTHWTQDDMGAYPSRFDLDSIEGSQDVPMLLWRACWHIAVLNTKAMQLCGILDDKGDLCKHFTQPEGGVVDMMKSDGDGDVPTGILRERAVEVAVAAMGAKTAKEKEKFVREGMEMCVQAGLCSVQTNDEGTYALYRELAASGALPLRVFLTPTCDEIKGKEQDQEEPSSSSAVRPLRFRPSHDFGSEREGRLCAERVKIFSDGSLGAETAAIRRVANVPVGFPAAAAAIVNEESDDGEKDKEKREEGAYQGVLIHSTASLVEQIGRARRQGWRVEIHAIGDASAEQVLTAMEVAYGCSDGNGGGDDEAGWERMRAALPVLTHCQVLGDDLMRRMARGGVIANVQPSFVPTDMRWVLDRMSGDHLQYSYAWKTLIERGITVAGGSDAPIESNNPFTGMFDAIYREARQTDKEEDTGENKEDTFRPEECLTFAEALYCYTVGAAKCAGGEVAADSCLGSVAPGFAADLVLVDVDVVYNPRKLHSYVPALVMVGGKVQVDNLSSSSGGGGGGVQTEGASTNMGGPFIPGKNGRKKRGWLQCDCCRVRK